jgi:hypothetical protein
MSWMSLAAAIILCGLSILRGFHGETFMGRALGGDFVAFYVTGKILNEYEPARIYDMALEVRLQHEAAAEMPKSEMLPFAHAPYIGQLYRPLALLPYKWAYIVWLIFSLALYAAGLLLLLRAAELPADQMKTGFLLGLSSMAFILETWIGGQISVVGFFLIAAFVYCRARNREFLAGFILACAMYKVTLIAIPVFMLLCGRRWRIVRGIIVGAVLMVSLSLATVGVRGCVAWFQTIRFFRYLAMGPLGALRRTKYVDIGSFFHLLLGDSSWLVQALGTATAATGIVILAIAWWRSPLWSAASRDLLLAATMSGSLVLNVYTPIYDTIMAGAAVALAAGALLKRADADRDALQAWLLLLYMVPWLTQSFADFLHFQPLTLVLTGFAYWALKLAWRQSRVRHADESRIPALVTPLAVTE